jgi:DNA repair protein RecN (Recombination protein N)
MPDAILKIELKYNKEADFGAAGCDEMIWKFQANKGHDLKELDKIASGGEMSRVMLALKAMLADVVQLPTMVFDEIDTGVSGNVAIKVGTIMQAVAKSHQVITITHLPQIAAKGTTHYYVYKDAINNKTFTSIKKLDPNERLMEVAKMIGGSTPSDAALTSARELMNS